MKKTMFWMFELRFGYKSTPLLSTARYITVTQFSFVMKIIRFRIALLKSSKCSREFSHW